MTGGAHMNVTYWPTPDDSPHGQVNDSHTVLYITNQFHFQSAHVQFSANDAAFTVQYLRALAAAATDLADQVQQKLEDDTVKAVLES